MAGESGVAHELPTKLLVTQELLGCASRKELCARFRDVNPRTEFDLERSHKWMQGRAKPRSGRVYEDWVRLLGTDRSPTWLVACTIEAFVEEVCRSFDADPLELKRRAGLDPERRVIGKIGPDAVHYLCGTYAAYSRAWSPYFRDHVIRGSLLFEPGRSGRFSARYRERLPSGPVELSGTAGLVGGVLHIELREAGSGAPFYVSVLLSGRPASVLSGVASGATFAGPDPLPSTTRIVLVRAPAGSDIDGSNDYLTWEPRAIEANLARLGVQPRPAAAAELCSFLADDAAPDRNQVSQAAHARLAGCFDPLEWQSARR